MRHVTEGFRRGVALGCMICSLPGAAAVGAFSMEIQARDLTAEKVAVGSVFVTASNVKFMEEDGNTFVRFEQPADSRSRSTLWYHPADGKGKIPYFDKADFCISAIFRMSNRRNGSFYVYGINKFRLGVDFAHGRPHVYFLIMPDGGKPMSVVADVRQTPVRANEWTHVHVNVHRAGTCALYVNGELSGERSMRELDGVSLSPSTYAVSTAYNRPADRDNPVAKMDLMRLEVKSGLMSLLQIERQAQDWLGKLKQSGND